ncbi:hypothetical protein L3Q82_016488, partial [Scortum barcoo]
MTVTALLIRLMAGYVLGYLHVFTLVNMLLLLTAQDLNGYCVQTADAAFVRIDPNRLQFFEYESISFDCAGFHGPSEWRVIKNNPTNSTQWETSAPSLNINPAFVSHSGEYWCENGEGERSNTVNITVTGGDVILESPAVPVMEQQTVTLHCRKKTTSSNPPADFYKEDHFIKTGYKGKIVFHNVSKFNEGLYKCSISGPPRTITRELDGCQSNLLLPHLKRQQLKRLHAFPLRYQQHNQTQLFQAFDHVTEADPDIATYANVVRHKKKRGCRNANSANHQETYAIVSTKRKDRVSGDANVAGATKKNSKKKKRADQHCAEKAAGPVILQSPALPVMEGEAVTLSCRNKTSSLYIADFYKDGILKSTGYHGNTTIPRVSKSDEGFYKCNILRCWRVSRELARLLECLNAFLQRPQCQELIRVKQVKTQTMYDDPAVRIVPSRLQLFEYKSVSFDCEGLNTTAGWRVVRKVKGKVSVCVSTWVKTAASVCAIKPAYPTDSGEYWCEAGEERSSAVNISITAGSVILESPAQPVMEGDSVTLRCRSRMTSSAHIADFYKDGLLVGSGSTGEMTIRAVSKSDEGLYKCSISDFGESPESWLAVRRFR